jgi:hypothetical protein
MRLPLIEQLDLRHEDVLESRTIRWPWLPFPSRVKEFIETGRVPEHSVKTYAEARKPDVDFERWMAYYIGMLPAFAQVP